MSHDTMTGLIWIAMMCVLFILCRETPAQRRQNDLNNWRPRGRRTEPAQENRRGPAD